MKAKIYLILRIVFSLAAAALLAAAIFVFVYAGWEWGLVCVIGAALCAALMFIFRRLQNDIELKENPPEPKGDLITGPVHMNDETADGDDSDTQ